MTSPVYFTVEADFKAFIEDASTDSDYDPQVVPISATVTFTPLINSGDVVLATNASPRPTGFIPAPITAIIDPADGRLKMRTGTDAGATGFSFAPVRLLGSSALLELDGPLEYSVRFSEVVLSNGRRGTIAGFNFEAPNSDTVLNLIEVARVPGQVQSGITKIAPGGVRLEDGEIVFSFAGMDIPEPIPFTPTFTSDEMTDLTATGQAVLTAADAAAARTAIGAESAAMKGASGGYAPLDATAKIDAAYLPSYVDDVLSYANEAAFPVTGETGKIYVAQDTGDAFRWTGSAYLRISDRVTAAGITDSTSVGRAVVTAATAAAARAALGAEFAGTVTAVKTAAYTATIGDVIPCDASGGGFTVTLPSAPVNGSWVVIKKSDTSDNTVLVQRSGSDVFNTVGGSSSIQLYIPSQTVTVRYDNGIWLVVDHSFGPSYLDSRYTGLNPTEILDSNGNRIIGLTASSATVPECYLAIANSDTTDGYVGLKAMNSAGGTSNLRLETSSTGVIEVYEQGSVGAQILRLVGPSTDVSLLVQPKGTGGTNFRSTTQQNGFFVQGAVTGSTPSLSATGTVDSNINIEVTPKGTGIVTFKGVAAVDVSSSQVLTNKNLTSATNTFPTLNQSTTGNAATATALQTARTINGVSFDGTANITVADSTKEPAIATGTAGQYWRGDKTFQTLDQDAVPSGTTNKAFTATEQTKLSGIATGATANSADATLLARANHTGTQPASTISDFSTAADARITNAIGTTVQAYDADLAAFAAKTAPTGVVVGDTDTQTLSGKTISGASNTLSNIALTSLTSSTSTALGVGSLELGHASDTTLTRASAGIVAVEGVNVALTTDTERTGELASGESTMSRRSISNNAVASGSQSLRLTYFTARKTETISSVRVPTGGTAASGATLCRIGIYEEAGNGDLTLVASTANDTNLWIATSTVYTKSLSASFTKTRGTRYAVGLLFVGTTGPNFIGQTALNAAEAGESPRLNGLVGSQSDLPSTVTNASITGQSHAAYSVLVP